jgi:hypothetical protein
MYKTLQTMEHKDKNFSQGVGRLLKPFPFFSNLAYQNTEHRDKNYIPEVGRLLMLFSHFSALVLFFFCKVVVIKTTNIYYIFPLLPQVLLFSPLYLLYLRQITFIYIFPSNCKFVRRI